MKPSHTPGPWKTLPRGGVFGGDLRLICNAETIFARSSKVDGSDEQMDEAHAIRDANATLISAAPEMLAALKLTLGNLRSLKGNAFRTFDTIDGWISEVEAAIAKAEGA